MIIAIDFDGTISRGKYPVIKGEQPYAAATLRKMAEQSGNADFLDGVKIIEDAYRPAVSKTFVKAEYKNEQNEWVSVPLGMTEAK